MRFWIAALTAVGLPALVAAIVAPAAGVYVAVAMVPAVAVGAVTFRRMARRAEVDGRNMDASLRGRSGIVASVIIVAAYAVCSLHWCGPALWTVLWNWPSLSEQGKTMAGAGLGLIVLALCPAVAVAYLFGTGVGQHSACGDDPSPERDDLTQ